MSSNKRKLIRNSEIEDIPRDKQEKALKKKIINAYDNLLVRNYCRFRFQIINSGFLETIEQHLPSDATVMDIGCGFGLFALYFSMRNPNRQIYGIDLNQNRIELAKNTANKLGCENVHFIVGDANTYRFTRNFDVIITLDLLHHIDHSSGNRLIASAYNHLNSKGVLLIKDVNVLPVWKLWFTYLLDKMMDFRKSVNYRHVKLWKLQVLNTGFSTVYTYYLNDILPYPHILIVCYK